MSAKNKKRGARHRTALSFEVEDLFKDEAIAAEATGDREYAKLEDQAGVSSEGAGEGGIARTSKTARTRPKKAARETTKVSRWRAPRGFRIFSEEDGGRGEEYLRVHRKNPSPEIFDETLFRLLPAIPGRVPRKVFCEGSVFPAVAAAAAGESNMLVLCERNDSKASAAILRLVPDASRGRRGDDRYDLILLCHDHLTGEKAADAVVEAAGNLTDGGVLVACFPAEALLDYSTNIRMEAPNMRNRIHRLCRTHFVLRAAGPLMQPSWDILVMGKRGGQASVPICRWRFTGNGVLPWQKCNEAFSSAPWLLVESLEQAGPAIARCVNYPWESFDLPQST